MSLNRKKYNIRYNRCIAKRIADEEIHIDTTANTWDEGYECECGYCTIRLKSIRYNQMVTLLFSLKVISIDTYESSLIY